MFRPMTPPPTTSVSHVRALVVENDRRPIIFCGGRRAPVAVGAAGRAAATCSCRKPPTRSRASVASHDESVASHDE